MTNEQAIRELQKGYLGDTENLMQAKHIAVKVLEKQQPCSPRGADSDTCPKCGTYNAIIRKRRKAVKNDIVYCWHCGQQLEI